MQKQDELKGFEKKRQRFSIDIRKQNRQAIFNKRRFKQNHQFSIEQDNQTTQQKCQNQIIDMNLFNQLLPLCKQQVHDQQLPQFLAYISDDDLLKKHYGMIGLRKLLAKETDPPIQQIIDAGMIPVFMQFGQQCQFPQLKLQAIWCMANIASGSKENCKALAQKGAIQLFVQCLKQNQKGIIDQAVWGIGNMAADRTLYRDRVLNLDGLTYLIVVCENSKSKSMLKNCAWTISNLSRGSPQPHFSKVVKAVPILCKLLKSQLITEIQILSDMCWSLSYLSQGESKKKIQNILDQGILEIVFKLCESQYHLISVPALRIVGNIALGSKQQIEELIRYGIFDLSNKLLGHVKKFIRRQISWTLSNITVGPQSHVQAFLSHKELVQKLMNSFNTDLMEIRKEICWVFANMGVKGNLKQVITFFVENGLIRHYIILLNEQDQEILGDALEALDKIFDYGQKQRINGINILLQQFESAGGSKRLQQLQFNESNTVYGLVIEILSKYYNIQEQQQVDI